VVAEVSYPYSLKEIQSNDALESEQFEQNFVLLQPDFVLLIEFQTANDSYGRKNNFQDGDPDVGEVRAIRCLAVRPGCESSGGCDPEDK
jgi:hypothetical protein